jgi:hypothetical protein
MVLEKVNFYVILGIIFIFMGITSIIYGYVIPSEFYPLNKTIGLGFEIIGIIFIIIGLILVYITKRSGKFLINKN